MKRFIIFSLFILVLLSLGLFDGVKPAYAACTNVPLSGNYTVGASCSFPYTNAAASNTSQNYADGVDTATGNNTATITISSTYTLTVPNGQTLVAGSVIATAANVSMNFVGTGQLVADPGDHIFVTDTDLDGFPANTTFTTTGTTRRASMSTTQSTYEDQYLSSTGVDCYDSNANAHPGQTAWYSTNRGDGSFDYNCDGSQTQDFISIYTCSACTNSSGYASTINTTSGYSALPGCGVTATMYTVTNSSCQNPAVAGCSGAYSTSSVTQLCH